MFGSNSLDNATAPYEVSTFRKFFCASEFCQIHIEFPCCRVDAAVLIHCLHSLGGETEANAPPQVLREVPLPLEVDMLDLLIPFVGERDDARLAVRALTEEVADTGAHHHGGCTASRGRLYETR